MVVWQQPSEPQNAVFTVVGKFRTAAEAEHAADELATIARTLYTWWRDLDSEAYLRWENAIETDTLAPVDAELAARYGVAWPFTVYWYAEDDGDSFDERLESNFDDDTNLEAPIDVFDNVVLLYEPHEFLSKGPQPFDALMRKLGAQHVAVEVRGSLSYANTLLTARLTIEAANEKTAAAIAHRWQRFLAEPDIAPPFVGYYESDEFEYAAPPEKRERLVQSHIEQEAIRERVREENEDLYRAWLSERDRKRSKQLENQYYALFNDALRNYTPLSEAEKEWADAALAETDIDRALYDDEMMTITPHVERQGKHIILDNIAFANGFMPALVFIADWLDALDCELTDITFFETQLMQPDAVINFDEPLDG